MAKKIVDEGKALLSSKTFWFGMLMIVNAVAALFGYADFKPSVDLQKILELIAGVGVIALRVVTVDPITKLK